MLPQSRHVTGATSLPSTGPAPFDPPPAQTDFTAIYQREFAYVWHSLRRLGIAQRDLADVTHDVFVTVYRRLPSYDASRPLRPWLFGVVFRVASDHMRLGRNARESIGMPLDVADSAPRPDDQLSDAQTRELVAEALATLDLDRRAVLIMHDLDEYPVPQIAEALAIPVKTLYSRLRSAREHFVAAIRRIRARRGER
jgi:RNA polymerase sigma-70 factor (ECF subfamily)